jgi:hypothetical protein
MVPLKVLTVERLPEVLEKVPVRLTVPKAQAKPV